MKKFKYSKGFKYITREQIIQICDILPLGLWVDHELITLEPSRIIIKERYAWDGPSGLTIDTKNTHYPSLIHDAFYQLMREGYLDSKIYRKAVDDLFLELLKEEGMCYLRRMLWYKMVRKYGAKYASKKKVKL